MVVRVDRSAQRPGREGGNDLVRVHVRARARACLEDVYGKVAEQLRIGAQRLTCILDCLAKIGVEAPQGRVGAGRRFLDQQERPDEGSGHGATTDREVLDRSLCLCAVERVARNLKRTHTVFNGAWSGGHCVVLIHLLASVPDSETCHAVRGAAASFMLTDAAGAR